MTGNFIYWCAIMAHMAIDKHKWADTTEKLYRFPDLCLDCAVDKSSEPSRVTVYDPRDEKIASAWISADCETGISLDQIQ